MSEGIDIPITVPGADLAKIALDQIVRSFTDLEREVIRAAEKSDATKDSFARLKDQFHTGAITAVQLRESLSGIAAQSSQVSAAVASAAAPVADLRSKSKGAADALVDVKDRGLDALAEKAAELGQRIGGVGGQIANVAIKSVAAFGGVGIAVTAVGAAVAFAAQAYDEYQAKVALTDARSAELVSTTHNLGAAYPSMATAVAGATTAVEAHTRAIEENQRILGQQLTMMNTGFSAESARAYTLQIQQTSGAVRELREYLHGASEEQIRQTLESGSATAQQTLLGVSFAHSADAAEENRRRMEALAVVHHRAAVAIAASKEEAVGAARAALESARADVIAAGEADAVSGSNAALQAATRRVTESTEALTVAQERAAVAHRNAAAGAQEAERAEQDLNATNEAALARGFETITRLAQTREKRKQDDEDQRRRAAVHHGTERNRILELQTALKQKNDAEEAAIREQERLLRERYRTELEGIDAVRRAELDALTERARLDEERAKERERDSAERAKASSTEGRRAAMRGARGETAAAQVAELADLRDPAAQQERLAEARRNHELERERSHLAQRYEMQRSYVDRMEELHSTEADGTRALAEGVSGAFAGMGQAIAKHAQGLLDGKESVGEALQGMLSDTLASLAQQAVVKGAMETAEGIAALAGIVTAPLAPGHFAAAGAYFGVAALAGIGAAATAPSGASAAPAAPAPARESAARVSGSKGGGSGDGATVYNVNFGGPMYGTGGVRQAARQMVGAINRGAIQGGVQLLPGVLQGAGAGA